MTHRILLVEDDPDVREMLSRALRADGHEVLEATTGAEASVLLQCMRSANIPFPIVVSDVFMPDGSGLALAAAVRAAGSRAPIVLVTGSDTEAVRAVAARLDAELFRKPLKLQQLRDHVAKLAS